ncbi:MAG: hypothetical protein ABSH44_11655 [Bryobacteraceae bacterium]
MSPAAGKTWPPSFLWMTFASWERLTRAEMDRIDIEDARATLKEAKEKGTIPLLDLMRELGD